MLVTNGRRILVGSDQANERNLKNGIFRSVNRRKTDNTMVKRKLTKEHTTIYKRLHRKIKIEQCESHNKLDMNSGISAPLVEPVVLLLL